MMTPQAPDQPAPDPVEILRRDVRLLGSLLGDVLREQGGQELWNAVEYIRTEAIRLRSGDPNDPGWTVLLDWARAQTNSRLLQLIRAFSIYFHLINLAEQQHRLRRLNERERNHEVIRESIPRPPARWNQS